MADLGEDLAGFLADQGPAPETERPELAYAEGFRGRVPDGLIVLWLEAGWGWYAGGLLRLCDPAPLQGVLEQVFRGDPDLRAADRVAYAYSAFGNIEVWHREHRTIKVFMLDGWIAAQKYVEPRRRRADTDSEIGVALDSLTRRGLDLRDDAGEPLFARARRALGPLGPDEVYGFVPLLAMGGAPRLEGLRRVKAREHLSLAAQARDFTLMDYGPLPARPVRRIGG